MREKTLSLGRTYANLTRNQSGVTIYDEMALMNDINAACARAAMPQVKAEVKAESQSIEERLAKLAELHSKGIIDENEYATKGQKILDEI